MKHFTGLLFILFFSVLFLMGQGSAFAKTVTDDAGQASSKVVTNETGQASSKVVTDETGQASSNVTLYAVGSTEMATADWVTAGEYYANSYGGVSFAKNAAASEMTLADRIRFQDKVLSQAQ